MGKNFTSTSKKIYDPILGFISFDEFERMVIDSRPFQRLHYLRQLGIAYYVYPSATHTRFEHSLGVMELASRIFKRICETANPSLYAQIPRKGSVEYRYWQKVIRIAALCHDIGHIPFSCASEEEFLKNGHEEWKYKLLNSKYFDPLWEKLQKHPGFETKVIGRNVKDDVIKTAIAQEKLTKINKNITYTPWETICCEIINGNFFGANHIDYLLRDSKFTGIVNGQFDYLQLVEMFRVLPSVGEEKTLSIGIDEKGIESCEALLLDHYFMHKKVYQHASVKAYNFHLKRFLQKLFANKKEVFHTESLFLDLTDANIIYELNKAAYNPKEPGHSDAASLVERKKRFKAILLPKQIDEKFLQIFKKENLIPDDQIFWEFTKQEKKQYDFSFPVSKKYIYLQKASESSVLLQKIALTTWNWVYITPEYHILLLKALYQ